MKKLYLPATCALLAIGSAQGAAVVYEGFDYTIADDGNISGANGGTGFSGAWVNTRNTPDFRTAGLTAGTLPVVGGKVQGSAWSGIARPLDGSLAATGALNNGSTVWFSAIADLTGANLANADINLALTSAGKFISGDFGTRQNLDGAAGVGFTHSRGNIRAAYWDASGVRTVGSSTSLSIGGANPSSTALVVGSILWGAGSETITLYAPDAALNLGAPITTLVTTGNLDQTAFNNLAIQFKDSTPGLDEIRFGETSDDVLGIVSAPIPEPSSTLLLGLGALLGLGIRRRR